MTRSNRTASTDQVAAGDGRRARLDLAEPGDWIEVDGTAGAGPRRGEVLEVIGVGQHLHFRVRWDEEHESLLYPAPEGGVVVHAKQTPTNR